MALSTPCIARQADAAEGEEGRAGARRRASGARQNLLFTGNHVANYSRGRERGATQPGIRQKARAGWGRGMWPGQGRARVGPGKPGAAPSRWAPARSGACARAAEICANVYVAAVLRMCRDARLLEAPRCAWMPVWRGRISAGAPQAGAAGAVLWASSRCGILSVCAGRARGPGAGGPRTARRRDAGPQRRGPSAPRAARQARELAREVYGRHEGVWPDHGDDGGHDGDGDLMSDTDSEGSGSAPLSQASRAACGRPGWLPAEHVEAPGRGWGGFRREIGPFRAGRLFSCGGCVRAWRARCGVGCPAPSAHPTLPNPNRPARQATAGAMTTTRAATTWPGRSARTPTAATTTTTTASGWPVRARRLQNWSPRTYRRKTLRQWVPLKVQAVQAGKRSLCVHDCRDVELRARGAAEALGACPQRAAASAHAGLRLRRRPGSSAAARGMQASVCSAEQSRAVRDGRASAAPPPRRAFLFAFCLPTLCFAARRVYGRGRRQRRRLQRLQLRRRLQHQQRRVVGRDERAGQRWQQRRAL